MTVSKYRLGWQLFILLLSIYVLIELSVSVIVNYSPTTQNLLELIDFGICLIFLGDFFYYHQKAVCKRSYWQKNWIDFVASIPFVGIFRFFRLFRVLRIFRAMKLLKVLRTIRGIRPLIKFYTVSKLRTILLTYILLLIFLLFYCSLVFYNYERPINESVHYYFDAFWWAFITVTSVGYGDIYPITTAGRICAMILTLGGMGLFSIITAELAATFLKYLHQEEQD